MGRFVRGHVIKAYYMPVWKCHNETHCHVQLIYTLNLHRKAQTQCSEQVRTLGSAQKFMFLQTDKGSKNCSQQREVRSFISGF